MCAIPLTSIVSSPSPNNSGWRAMGGRFRLGKRKTVQALRDGSVQTWRSWPPLLGRRKSARLRRLAPKAGAHKSDGFLGRIQRKTLKNFETGVAPETRRIDKIIGPTAPLLQARACGGYGRPAQQFGRHSRRTNEAISRLQGFCRWALVSWSALVPAAPGGGNCAAAPDAFDWHGERGDHSRTGSIGRP